MADNSADIHAYIRDTLGCKRTMCFAHLDREYCLVHTQCHVTDATVLAAIGHGKHSQLKHFRKRKNYDRFHEIITQARLCPCRTGGANPVA